MKKARQHLVCFKLTDLHLFAVDWGLQLQVIIIDCIVRRQRDNPLPSFVLPDDSNAGNVELQCSNRGEFITVIRK